MATRICCTVGSQLSTLSRQLPTRYQYRRYRRIVQEEGQEESKNCAGGRAGYRRFEEGGQGRLSKICAGGRAGIEDEGRRAGYRRIIELRREGRAGGTLPESATSCHLRPCQSGRSTTMGRWLLLKAMYIPPSCTTITHPLIPVVGTYIPLSCSHHNTNLIPLESQLRVRYVLIWKMNEHKKKGPQLARPKWLTLVLTLLIKK